MSRFPAPSSAVLVLAALLPVTVARAEPARLVVWPRAPDDATATAEHAVRHARIAVVPFSALGKQLAERGAAELERERAQVSAVETALRQARTEALARKWKEMAATLAAAETAALDVVGQAGHTDALWELAFQRGLAGLWGGDAAAARARFLLALEIDPERKPSRELYAPDVLTAFTEAADARAATPARPIALRVSPADAHVVIDGAPVIDNARARQLRPGLHVVVATAPGHVASAHVVAVGTQASLDVTLHPIGTGGAADRIGASWSQGRLDPSTRSGRAAIAVAASEIGATGALVIDIDADGTGATARVVAQSDASPAYHRASIDAAVRAALVGAGLVIESPRDGRRPDDDDGGGSLLGNGWFWLIAGGVALAAGGAIALAAYDREHIGELFGPAE